MSLGIGIVGLPNVGKSTLFKALTRNNVLIANYPFATIEPNTGVVAVPDERLDKLASLVQPEQVVPATVKFVDIAGLVAGAHKGEGLGNKFLAHIRESQVICLVVRDFTDPDIIHVTGSTDPERDIATIKTELILADLETLQGSRQRLAKLAKGSAQLKPAVQLVDQVIAKLDAGELPSAAEAKDWGLEFSKSEESGLKSLASNLLCFKPIVYVFNVDEDTLKDPNRLEQLAKHVPAATAGQPIFICAKLEAELAELDETEAKELLASVDLEHSGLESLIKAGYETLGLATFFTAGPKEVKAWTINKGDKAPQAASVIHTDFERGFIAAEVVAYEDLVTAGSWNEAKTGGKVRSEGKDYTVQDGDVMLFRFNV